MTTVRVGCQKLNGTTVIAPQKERDSWADGAQQAWTTAMDHMSYLMSEAHAPLTELLLRIQGLPEDRPLPITAIQWLKHASRMYEVWMKLPKVPREFAELKRIRAAVSTAAHKLHAEYATGDLPCRCRGCELIREVDAP